VCAGRLRPYGRYIRFGATPRIIMRRKPTLTFLLLAVSVLVLGQNNKLPPRDDSGKTPEPQLFVKELKEIIKSKNSQKLLTLVHPQIKLDFDDGIGIEKFRKNWKPEDKNSSLWTIMNKIVGLGGVFVKNRTNPFFDFVFPYVNQVDLEDGDDYFITLVVTNKNVKVREKPDLNSKVVGQLSYDIVTYDYKKSKDYNWYFIKTTDKKISCYISADFAYSPVDYRMFLTKRRENG
jgi:hypothetical protein